MTTNIPGYVAASESEKLIQAEKQYIEQFRRERSGHAGTDLLPWAGIALSGGGIRAAIFSLGAIQALVESDLLKRFDYISTVSGGGYIGTSLQWWWSKARYADDPTIVANQSISFGLSPHDFPYGVGLVSPTGQSGDSETQKRNLGYLRNHGYYLTPGNGINVWSAVSVVLRTVLLSLIVWIPLLVAFFVLVQLIDEGLLQPAMGSLLAQHELSLDSFQSPLGSLIANLWACKSSSDYLRVCAFNLRLFYALILWGYLLFAVAVFILISIAFALLSRAGQDIVATRVRVFRVLRGLILAALLFFWAWNTYRSFTDKTLSLFVPLIIGSMVGAVLLGSVFVELFRHRAVNGSYFLRRTLERYFGLLFLPTLALLVIGLIPALPSYLIHNFGNSGTVVTAGTTLTSAFTVISGALSALYGYYTMVQKVAPGLAGRILAPLGAAVYLYGTLVFSYVFGVLAFQALYNPDVFDPGDVVYVQIAAIVLLLIALLVGAIASVNQIGLHRFYRDRLMEAFMPASAAVVRGRADYSPVADRLQLSDLIWSPTNPSIGSSTPCVPFPLINTLAILTRDPDRKVTTRGGDNFVLSPLFVGSNSTGWLQTTSYVDWFGPMTLASAMAASGAAVNSNAGYLGTGATRGQLVSMAMAILNMRLGLWVGNPARRSHFWSVPTYFRPMLTAGVLGFGHTKESLFLELADGGNFENLGLYELVRRKLTLILVVDGEADATIALPALVSACHRVYEDFEATVSFKPNQGPEQFVPVVATGGATYPEGAAYASAPFLIGRIVYKDGTIGTLIYIKATLIKDLAFTTSGYRARHIAFPHQTTVDQFFDADQFEAYRDLGYCSAKLMINKLNLATTIGQPWSAPPGLDSFMRRF
jgi:hypothetical protein